MPLDIPSSYEPRIAEVAQAQHISTDQAVGRILEAGLQRLNPVPDYLAILDQARQSPNRFKSREEVDRYIADLRSEW